MIDKVTARRSTGRKRPKGYAAWRPQRKTKVVLDQIDAVISEYREYLPLTVRQIFYRLVGAFGFPKSEQAYERLGNYLVRARRARIIPFEHIRDDSASVMNHLHFDGEDDFYSYVHRLGRNYTQDKLAGQGYAIRLHCEAEGMMPQMHRALEDFSVPVYSCSGFDSLTSRRDLARWFHDSYVYEGKTPVMLHLGDYDPDGESIFESLVEDVWAFLSEDAPGLVSRHDRDDLFVRVALVEEHVSIVRLAYRAAEGDKLTHEELDWGGDVSVGGAAAGRAAGHRGGERPRIHRPGGAAGGPAGGSNGSP